MYGRIPYLNNSLISWAIQQSNLRHLLYYIWVCSRMPLSAPLHMSWLFTSFTKFSEVYWASGPVWRMSTVIYPFCFAVYTAWIGICAWVIAIYDHVSFVSTFCASLYVLWFLMVTMANMVFCCWFAVSCIVSKFPVLPVLDNRGTVHPLVHINYSTPGCQCVDIFKKMDMLVLVVYCKDYREKSLCAKLYWRLGPAWK